MPESPAPLVVVLAETHTRMRASMRALLEAAPAVRVAADAGDLALMYQHVAGHRPDVVVLDLRMPDGSSLDAIRRLGGAPPVVVSSIEEAPGFARRALAAGARGFVLKDRADVDLAIAIRAAVAGGLFVSEPVAARL
jgi:two-component system response regulator NreC